MGNFIFGISAVGFVFGISALEYGFPTACGMLIIVSIALFLVLVSAS